MIFWSFFVEIIITISTYIYHFSRDKNPLCEAMWWYIFHWLQVWYDSHWVGHKEGCHGVIFEEEPRG